MHTSDTAETAPPTFTADPGALQIAPAEPTVIRSAITELLAALEAAKAAGAAWLDLELAGDRIVVVWPGAETATRPATEPPGARERLPWDHYAPELRDELKALTTRYRPDVVADAAVRLAELIAVYGPVRPRGPEQ